MGRGYGVLILGVVFAACAGAQRSTRVPSSATRTGIVVPVASATAQQAKPCIALSEAPGLRSFAADGGTLAVVDGRKLVVYSTLDWSILSSVDAGLPVQRLQLSRKGEYVLLLAAKDGTPLGTVLLVNARSGKVLLERAALVPVHAEREKAQLSPDGRWLALAAPDKTAGVDAGANEDMDLDAVTEHVEVFALPTLRSIAVLRGPEKVDSLPQPRWRPRKLPAPPTPPRNVSGPPLPMGPMGPIIMHPNVPVPNAAPDWTLDKLEAGASGIADLVWAADSRTLMSVWSGGAASFVDAGTGQTFAVVSAGSTSVGSWRHALSPSGRWAVLSRLSGAQSVYDLHQRRGRTFYDPLCPGSHGWPSFSRDERSAVISGGSYSVCLVDLATAQLTTLLPPKPPTTGAYEDEGIRGGGPWASDDKSVVVQDMAGQAVLWDLRTKTGNAVAHDGQTARQTAMRTKDGSLVFLNELGKPLAELVGDQLRYLPLNESSSMFGALSPDGELVLQGPEPPLTLLSTRSGKVEKVLKEGRMGIHDFDATSRFVYTTDEALLVWRVSDGTLVFTGNEPCASRTPE